MIQAIDKNLKTKTRRTKGLEKFNISPKSWRYDGINEEDNSHYMELIDVNGKPSEKYFEIVPPYEVGDVLWVRETFFDASMFLTAPIFSELKNQFAYKADETFIGCHKWKPSIFMPKEACRTFLKVKSIRVERLQDISEEDAQAEGAHFLYHGLGTVIVDSHPDWEKLYKPHASYKDGFHYIWKYINGEDSWQFNPYVFVYEFEKIEKPESF